MRNNLKNMEKVCKWTGNWITFKDSASDIFRVEFLLFVNSRREAWQFTDSTEGESCCTGSLGRAWTNITHSL